MKKITFNVDSVLPQLAQVASVVNSKNTIQILDSVMVETFSDGSTAIFTTSDGEVTLQMKAAVESEEPTKFCVEAKTFLQTLRGLNGRVVTLTLTDESPTIEGKYDNGNFKLPYQDASMFPTPNKFDGEQEERILDAQCFLRAVDMVKFSVASDELRPQMNGVHVDFFADSMVAVASDGHKLAKFSDLSITRTDDKVSEFILPTKPSNLLTSIMQKAVGDVKITFDARMLSVSNSDWKLTTRLIEGRFPNYNSVIPKDLSIEAVVNKENILGALKRVLPLGSSSSEMVVLNFRNNAVIVSAEDIDFSTSASEMIPCEYSGESLRIAFKGSFLAMSVQNIDDELIVFSMSDPSRACVLRPFEQAGQTEFLSLLMPMMLND